MQGNDLEYISSESQNISVEPAEVLVVDDDPELLVVASLALEVFGYRVTPSLRAKTAIDLLENNHFDLLITDLIMEDMDGIALLKESKKLSPDTKVILMTAFYDPELILHALENDADDYMLKPFSLQELESKAASCLGERAVNEKRFAHSA